MDELDRLIVITVQDMKGKPLTGANVEFEADGIKPGVRSAQGRATHQMPGPRVPVKVTARYKKRKAQSTTLAPEQDTWLFQFKEQFSLKKKIAIGFGAAVAAVIGLGQFTGVFDFANAACKFASGSECRALWQDSAAQPVPAGTPKRN